VPGGITADLDESLGESRTAWLDLLMVSVVEPSLRTEGLVAVDRYPAEQGALARLEPGDPRVARRFELFLDGLEIANGYHELADAHEQRRRFEADRRLRHAAGLPDAPPDEALLAALEAGLPDCCGVALGFDRLLTACLGLDDIRAVVAFPTPDDA
jgi:lysyl-tRNA synthetase class 2